MLHELIYTSAPRGLFGGHGFATVATTPNLPRQLVQRLEALSAYRHVYGPSDANVALNPPAFSHIWLSSSGARYHVISRVTDAGVDYTQRSNKLAQHIAIPEHSLPPTGPAALMRAKNCFMAAWEGEPRLLTEPRLLETPPAPPAPCSLWRKQTGDAGWAGVLAEQDLDPATTHVSIIFEPGCDMLALLAETFALLPAEQQWKLSWSTYFTKFPPDIECRIRCIVAGGPEEAVARRHASGATLLDLRNLPGKPADSPWVSAAREGTIAARDAAISSRSARSLTVSVGAGAAAPLPQGRAVVASRGVRGGDAPADLLEVAAQHRKESDGRPWWLYCCGAVLASVMLAVGLHYARSLWGSGEEPALVIEPALNREAELRELNEQWETLTAKFEAFASAFSEDVERIVPEEWGDPPKEFEEAPAINEETIAKLEGEALQLERKLAELKALHTPIDAVKDNRSTEYDELMKDRDRLLAKNTASPAVRLYRDSVEKHIRIIERTQRELADRIHSRNTLLASYATGARVRREGAEHVRSELKERRSSAAAAQDALAQAFKGAPTEADLPPPPVIVGEPAEPTTIWEVATKTPFGISIDIQGTPLKADYGYRLAETAAGGGSGWRVERYLAATASDGTTVAELRWTGSRLEFWWNAFNLKPQDELLRNCQLRVKSRDMEKFVALRTPLRAEFESIPFADTSAKTPWYSVYPLPAAPERGEYRLEWASAGFQDASETTNLRFSKLKLGKLEFPSLPPLRRDSPPTASTEKQEPPEPWLWGEAALRPRGAGSGEAEKEFVVLLHVEPRGSAVSELAAGLEAVERKLGIYQTGIETINKRIADIKTQIGGLERELLRAQMADQQALIGRYQKSIADKADALLKQENELQKARDAKSKDEAALAPLQADWNKLLASVRSVQGRLTWSGGGTFQEADRVVLLEFTFGSPKPAEEK